jgi:hypothetical protein
LTKLLLTKLLLTRLLLTRLLWLLRKPLLLLTRVRGLSLLTDKERRLLTLSAPLAIAFGARHLHRARLRILLATLMRLDQLLSR